MGHRVPPHDLATVTFSLIFCHSPSIPHAQPFLLFLKYVKLVLTSGPLHLLFCLLQRFFPQIFTRLAPSLHSMALKFPDSLILNSSPSVCSSTYALPCFPFIFLPGTGIINLFTIYQPHQKVKYCEGKHLVSHVYLYSQSLD